MATCRECGAAIEAKRHGTVFCCAGCRKTWNNRRMVRGAEMYDLFMALRHERDKAKQAQVFSMLANLASAYKAADDALRAGRKSYNLREALARLPLAYGREGDRR